MSDHLRNFARRHITWKLTNVTRGCYLSENTPAFLVSLGDCETEWYLRISENRQHLGIYLYKCYADSMNFSVKLNVAVMRRGPNPTYKLITSFAVSCKETFKEDDSGFGFSKFIPLDVLFEEKHLFLVDGVLTVEVQLELIEDPKIKESPVRMSFLQNYEKLINNEKYSDFVFICSDGKKVYVQKCNIAIHCEAFATMIEAGFSESKTNSAKIADVDSETMLELVRFLYSGRVKNIKRIQEALAIAANKYRLEDLKNLCVSSLMESLTDENVVNVFAIADLLNEEHLKKNCIDYIKCNHFRLQKRIRKEDLSKELTWAIWKSMDLDPIRIWFEDERLSGIPSFESDEQQSTADEEDRVSLSVEVESRESASPRSPPESPPGSP